MIGLTPLSYDRGGRREAPWRLDEPAHEFPRMLPNGRSIREVTRPKPKRPVVTISESAHRAILDELKPYPAREAGGVLAGSAVPGRNRHIERAAFAGMSNRTRTSVTLDVAELQRAAGDLHVIGTLHTHPTGGAATLSDIDLAGALKKRDAFRRPLREHIELLVTRENPLKQPTLTPFLVRSDEVEVGVLEVVPDATRAIAATAARSVSALAAAPHADLYRGITDIRTSTTASRPELFGRFAVYDTWTEIRSPIEGHFLERFARHSLKRTIAERGDAIRVLYCHGYDLMLESKPIALPTTIRSEPGGVDYTADMLDGVPELLTSGLREGLYGCSFAFSIVDEDWVEKPGRGAHNPHGLPERTVLDADVSEFGPVPRGAYPTATAGVRGAGSMTDHFRSMRERLTARTEAA